MVACDDGSDNYGGNVPASLYGTYGYSSSGPLTVTFRSDGTFTGRYSNSPSVNGTYRVSGSDIRLSQRYYGNVWVIINSNMVMDGAGDFWRRR